MHDSKLLEVEVKYRVSPKMRAALLRRISKLGGKNVKRENQSDIYYTGADRDLIANEECLRIRTVNGRSELTWKPPTSEDMKKARRYWKQEVNVAISGQEAAVKELLKGLRYIEYVEVKKERTSFTIRKHQTIALDQIEDVGLFVEIETMAYSHDEGLANNHTLANALGLSEKEVVSQPYRDLVPRK